MGITVTELTVRLIESNTYDALSTTVGVIVILTLLVLLLEREALAAAGVTTDLGPATALVVPLVAPWALIIAVRLISLL